MLKANIRCAVFTGPDETVHPLRRLLDPSGTSEIGQHNPSTMLERCDQYVIRLDIAMYDPSVMEILEGEKDLSDDQGRGVFMKPPAVFAHEGKEITVRDEFGEHEARFFECVRQG